MAIRYDKKINAEIDRTIRNFNNKINRLEKTERDLILPDKISKKELKESVYNRTELYRKIRELQRFSKRGAEKTIITSGGVKTSRYELDNLKRETKRIKSALTRDLKRLETSRPKVFGKLQTGTFSQMGDPNYLNIKARREALNKDLLSLDTSGYKRFTALVEKISRNKTYMNNIFKGNYVKMITDLGYYYGYNNEKLKTLEDSIKNLNSDDFLKMFNEEKSIKAILDYYPVITDTLSGIDPADIKEDVANLYDNLIDNLDEIIKDYA